jgi:hypothetical protein
MAHLRVRVELQRPSRGIEMSKLEKLSKEAQRVLRSLGEDLRIPSAGTWVAQEFYNQGLGFDAVYETTDVDDLQVDQYVHALDDVSVVDESKRWEVPGVSARTIVASAHLARLADDGETVRIGIYNDNSPEVTWRPLIKSRAEAIIEHYEETISYRGMLQGIIHSLYKESDPPYFDLRDIASRDLVKCEYEADQYDLVYAALKDKRAVVLVAGWINTRRSDRAISKVRVERIQPTTPIKQTELERFFGSSPGWTGDLTTEDFIDSVRRRDTDAE